MMIAIAAMMLRAGAADAAVDFDVVVYGSTPAGIAAATAAGQLGMKVSTVGMTTRAGGEKQSNNLNKRSNKIQNYQSFSVFSLKPLKCLITISVRYF